MEEKIQKPGLMMVMKRPSLRQFSWLLGGSLLLGALFWLWLAVQQQEATLAIRPVGLGIGMPDGFSVWHHLDVFFFFFKSILPQKEDRFLRPGRGGERSSRPRSATWLYYCPAGGR